MLVTEKVITETRIKCMYPFTCGSLRVRAMPPVSWQSQWICRVCYHVKTHTGHGVRCTAGRGLALRDARKQYPSISSELANEGLRVGAAQSCEDPSDTPSRGDSSGSGGDYETLWTKWHLAFLFSLSFSSSSSSSSSFSPSSSSFFFFKSSRVLRFQAVLNFLWEISVDMRGQKLMTVDTDMKY